MSEVDDKYPSDGIVEADETYIDGKQCGRGSGYKGNETIVFGMVGRGVDVMTKVVPNVKRKTLQPIIEQNVTIGSAVHTGELPSYSRLEAAGYRHDSVNHSAGEYVGGNCHVSSIESCWSRSKQSICGTHVHVSARQLWKYAKEFECRGNCLREKDPIFANLVTSL